MTIFVSVRIHDIGVSNFEVHAAGSRQWRRSPNVDGLLVSNQPLVCLVDVESSFKFWNHLPDLDSLQCRSDQFTGRLSNALNGANEHRIRASEYLANICFGARTCRNS